MSSGIEGPTRFDASRRLLSPPPVPNPSTSGDPASIARQISARTQPSLHTAAAVSISSGPNPFSLPQFPKACAWGLLASLLPLCLPCSFTLLPPLLLLLLLLLLPMTPPPFPLCS